MASAYCWRTLLGLGKTSSARVRFLGPLTRAVRETPVPTVAIVQGNCFFCGVEFALSCDFRIASDTCETIFYMTELNDYLFVPLFGGTWNLPATVGLGGAIDLLLWGERWSARNAFDRGLIDCLVPYEDLVDRKDRFFRPFLEGRHPSRRLGRVDWGRDEDAIVDRTERRIADLPPLYQGVYADALELLREGARQTSSYEEHQRRELRAAADSALSSIGKAAYGFFYIRQMAAERAVGRASSELPAAQLRADIYVPGFDRDFARDLCTRRLPATPIAGPGFRLVSGEEGTGNEEQGTGNGEQGSGEGEAVRVGYASGRHCRSNERVTSCSTRRRTRAGDA